MVMAEDRRALDDPVDGIDARSREDGHLWIKEENFEYDAMIQQKVMEIVDRPPQHIKVLPSRSVYRYKKGKQGEIIRRKVRFVVKGCCDPLKKLKDTFAPTMSYVTMRIIIALSALFRVLVHQMDIKTAFLNSVLKEPIYVEQPDYRVVGDRKKKVMKLKKALYGLVEAPKLWYDTLIAALMTVGFTRIPVDPCLFVMIKKIDGRKHITVIGAFVDDLLIFSTSDEILNQVKTKIRQKFELSDMGPAEWILGMRVQQTPDRTTIDQGQYVRGILSRFQEDMDEFASRKTIVPNIPLRADTDLSKSRPDEATVEYPYREVIGCVAHLMTGTRPDIAFAVSWLSRHLMNPAQRHWNVAMNLLRYLKSKPDLAISFPRRQSPVEEFDFEMLNSCMPWAAADADFGNDVDDSLSTGAYVVIFCNAIISWRSKRQGNVATSATLLGIYCSI